MTLRTRKPTGRVPWPFVVVEGGEKSGKSWMAAVLSASTRVGRTVWLDLGEGAGDEYGAIPGTRYEIALHDGTWQAIIGVVEDARDEAKKAAAAGEPPFVLVIDSMTQIWDMLKDWASNRARETESNKKKLRADPNAEIVVAANFWNDANARHKKLVTILMTFPGIVVATARGKEVAEIGPGGAPVAGKKGYRVEGHKELAFDATVWLRVSRDDHPVIVGARSVHAGIQHGSDKPRAVPGLELERLIFDVLKCNPTEATPRALTPLQPGSDAPEEASAGPALANLEQRNELVSLLKRADLADKDAALRYINGVIKPAAIEGTAELTAEQIVVVIGRVRSYIAQQTPPTDAAAQEPAAAVEPAATAAAPPAEPAMVTDAHHRHMHALWRELGFDGDHNRDNRLRVLSMVLDRPVETSKSLTAAEADRMIEALQAKRREQVAATAQAQATQSTEPITPDQRTTLIALLNERVGTDAKAWLVVVNAAIAPAVVKSAKDLTEFQAAQAIGHVQGLPALVPA